MYTEYGRQWYYQKLRVDCKHRMEFILNFEPCLGEELRQEMVRQTDTSPTGPIRHVYF